MDLFEKLDSELKAPMQKMPKFDIDSPFKRLIALSLGFRNAKPVPGVAVHNVKVGANRIRVFDPGSSSGAATVWIHGGGLILGRPEQDDLLLSKLAKTLGIKIFALSYRLAPKNPYPAGLEDCLFGYRHIRSNASEFGIDPSQIVLAGASAGGCLATSMALTLRHSGESPLALALLYPMLDDRTAANQELDDKSLVWTNKSNRWAWQQYLGQKPGASEPIGYSVPGRVADLSALPPTWIGVGDVDLFYQEDIEFAQRLLLAGVETQLKIFRGYPHATESIVPDAEISKSFVADLMGFVRTQMKKPGN